MNRRSESIVRNEKYERKSIVPHRNSVRYQIVQKIQIKEVVELPEGICQKRVLGVVPMGCKCVKKGNLWNGAMEIPDDRSQPIEAQIGGQHQNLRTTRRRYLYM